MNPRRFFSTLCLASIAMALSLPHTLSAGSHSQTATLGDPNPFREQTTFQLTMPQAGSVSIIVYDVLGQQVRVLENEKHFETGVYSILWDGKDEAGVPVLQGVYVCVLYSKGVVVKSVKAVKIHG